jgi:alpha-L-fucosidase
MYWAQNRAFNPTNDREWAQLARRAGMKYVVFTTKHHDGFCMFDAQQTDYKITAPACPFSRSLQADVTRAVFDAFRAEGLAIGAYFSKSDWHSPYYWDPARPAMDRNPNYDTSQEPERWEKFVQFAHAQMMELCANYETIDLLWLDAGQVKPPTQDLRMDEIVPKLRRLQPGLIVVDRLAGTQHENVLTPEQEVPDSPPKGAWESCITMGKQWSYKPDDEYKPTSELIRLLTEINAKGGNLLLNIGPDAHGELPLHAVQRLNEIAEWMVVHGSEVHAPRR